MVVGSTPDPDPAPDPYLGCNFLYCIDIMLTLGYLQNSTFCFITQFQVVRFDKFLHRQGLLFQTIILSTNGPMLSSKFNILCHNSIISGQS